MSIIIFVSISYYFQSDFLHFICHHVLAQSLRAGCQHHRCANVGACQVQHPQIAADLRDSLDAPGCEDMPSDPWGGPQKPQTLGDYVRPGGRTTMDLFVQKGVFHSPAGCEHVTFRQLPWSGPLAGDRQQPRQNRVVGQDEGTAPRPPIGSPDESPHPTTECARRRRRPMPEPVEPLSGRDRVLQPGGRDRPRPGRGCSLGPRAGKTPSPPDPMRI